MTMHPMPPQPTHAALTGTNPPAQALPPSWLPRTGAFGAVRTRWLPVWAGLGAVLVSAVFDGLTRLGLDVSDELLGALLYVPVIAWLAVMVVGRGGVHLGVMLRWPRLGSYWFVVAGMLVVQFLFSIAAITLTDLVVPWLDDSLAGVGEGNLVLAVLGIVILPPLVEEVTFRGVLIERFAVKWRGGVAVVLSAVFFGILHADPVGAGMFGVVTGLLYLRTGSLWPGIIIHFVNNLVAFAALRNTGSTVEAPAPEVADSLASAGVFLLLSVPFLVWFIRANWPARGAPTPYQRHELQVGLPSRTFRSVVWSGSPRPVLVEVSTTQVVVRDFAAPIAMLPLHRVGAVYPSSAGGITQVVILLRDGSWTTMEIPPGKPKVNAVMARTISDRAQHPPGS